MPPAKTTPKATPKATPRLKGEHIERMPVSQTTIDDPLHVAVNPSSTHVVAWPAKGREYEYTSKGYEVVRPEELESMEGGQYFPRDKDFGVYFFFNKDAPIVEQGQHILMKVAKARRDAWQKRDLERALNQAPQKTDPDEKANLTEDDVTTIGKEIK